MSLLSMSLLKDLVSLEAVVRGIKFYRGVRHRETFSRVTFVRERANIHDEDAVMVHMKRTQEVLEKEVAVVIARSWMQASGS